MELDEARPIWRQLLDEFRRRIAVGQWVSGQQIPSVRELAVELGVNPNTAQRALAELERLDLARSERTTGRFVTRDAAAIAAVRAELARATTDDYVARIRGLDLDLGQATRLVEDRWTATKEDGDGRH